MKFRKINVHPLRGADPRLRAVANILTTDGYAINGIRVYEDMPVIPTIPFASVMTQSSIPTKALFTATTETRTKSY